MPSRKSPRSTNGSRAEVKRSAKPSGGRDREQAGKRPEPPFPAQRQRMSGDEWKMEPTPQYAAATYRPADKLAGKVALITGGDSGIGRAVAVLYAKEGADVAIVYLRDDQRDADETRQAVEAEGRRCLLIPGDVQDPAFCRDAVARTVRELGKLDVLVNNAAYAMVQQSIEEISDEQFDRTLRTNVYGYFYMARAAAPHLKPGACIIMTGSGAGIEGMGTAVDYALTKAAAHSMTKSLSQQLMDRRIRVNCVAPGPVWTALVQVSQPEEKVAKFGSGTPIGRPAQPEELAPAYVFLASDADSSYVSGEILCVFGGKGGPG